MATPPETPNLQQRRRRLENTPEQQPSSRRRLNFEPEENDDEETTTLFDFENGHDDSKVQNNLYLPDLEPILPILERLAPEDREELFLNFEKIKLAQGMFNLSAQYVVSVIQPKLLPFLDDQTEPPSRLTQYLTCMMDLISHCTSYQYVMNHCGSAARAAFDHFMRSRNESFQPNPDLIVVLPVHPLEFTVQGIWSRLASLGVVVPQFRASVHMSYKRMREEFTRQRCIEFVKDWKIFLSMWLQSQRLSLQYVSLVLSMIR